MRTDEELARAFGDGDDDALGVLYDRYRRPLFAYCVRVLGQAEEACDVVQDVFAAAFAHRGELRRLRLFRAWAYTVARNRCLSAIRRNENHARLAPAIADRPPFESPTAAVETERPAKPTRAWSTYARCPRSPFVRNRRPRPASDRRMHTKGWRS